MHISAQADQHPGRARVQEGVADVLEADPPEREQRQHHADQCGQRQAGAARGGHYRRPRPGGQRLERGQAARGRARPAVAGQRADRAPRRGAAPSPARAWRSRPRRRRAPPRRRAATRSAPPARQRRAPSRCAATGSSQRSRSASASSVASPRGTSTPSHAVAHDVAVAGDVRGDHRRARGERLGQHHAEALAAQRRRAQHVGVARHAMLLVVGDLAQRHDAAVVEQQRIDLLRVRADEVSRAGTCSRSASKARSSTGRPLALDRLADEGDPQLARRRRWPRRASGRARRRWGSRGSGRRRSAARSTRPPRRRRCAR